MFIRKMILNRISVVLLLLMGSRASTLAGQGTTASPPQIIVSGRGEVEVTPDRAELVVQVETRASDGARAAEGNAAVIKAVLDTLRRGFSLGDKDLATVGYSLRPQLNYPGDGKAPQVAGYIAVNAVRVRTGSLARLGAMIDAAIRKGATGVSGPSFFLANTDSARRRAVALAVDNARRDAEAIAVAAGGRLGAVIEISNEPVDQFEPVPMQAMLQDRRVSAETPIQVGEHRIQARVTAKWRFVSP